MKHLDCASWSSQAIHRLKKIQVNVELIHFGIAVKEKERVLIIMWRLL